MVARFNRQTLFATCKLSPTRAGTEGRWSGLPLSVAKIGATPGALAALQTSSCPRGVTGDRRQSIRLPPCPSLGPNALLTNSQLVRNGETSLGQWSLAPGMARALRLP